MKRRPVIWLLCLVSLGCSRHPESQAVRPVDSAWEAQIVDAEPGIGSRESPPLDGWTTSADFSLLDGSRSYWGRTQLPETPAGEATLMFRNFAEGLVVFVENRRIYEYHHRPDAWRRPGSMRYHVVSLPNGWQGATMHVWLERPRPSRWRSGYLVAHSSAVPDTLTGFVVDPVRRGLLAAAMGIAFAFLGLFVLAVSVTRAGSRDLMLPALGGFTALYGLRELVRSHLPVLLGLSPLGLERTDSTINYLINVPGWIFFLALLGSGWRRSLQLVVWMMAGLAVAGPFADLLAGRPYVLGQVNNVIVILAISVAMLNIWLGRARLVGRELRFLLLGIVVLAVFSIHDNLSALGLVPSSGGFEVIGFAVFIACLGAVAASRFFDRERQLATLGHELATARKIQSSILPQRPPEVAGLDVAARYVPMSEVAGDYYDYLLDEDGGLRVVVADVSGHGVPAALVASMVKIAVVAEGVRTAAPEHLLDGLAGALQGRLQHSFVTASCAAIDPARTSLRVSCAGHHPALLRRTDGDVSEVGALGLVLGRLGPATYSGETVQIEAGDRVVLFTDGVVEATSPGGEPFGEQRLRGLLAASTDDTATELADVLVDSVRRHAGRSGGQSLDDDLTVVVVDVVADRR